jgi:hypothetical protein
MDRKWAFDNILACKCFLSIYILPPFVWSVHGLPTHKKRSCTFANEPIHGGFMASHVTRLGIRATRDTCIFLSRFLSRESIITARLGIRATRDTCIFLSRFLSLRENIITGYKLAKWWGGGERRGEERRGEERRGERRETDCKFIVGLGTRTKKIYKRDKWTIY